MISHYFQNYFHNYFNVMKFRDLHFPRNLKISRGSNFTGVFFVFSRGLNFANLRGFAKNPRNLRNLIPAKFYAIKVFTDVWSNDMISLAFFWFLFGLLYADRDMEWYRKHCKSQEKHNKNFFLPREEYWSLENTTTDINV